MKRYKLLKDTPTIKAGTVFEEVVSDFDELKELVRITPVGAKTSPQWTIQDINNFNDWFEEVKEFKEWKPKEGEQYLYIGPVGRPCIDTRRSADRDEHRLSIGNCYPPDTSSNTIIKEQKLIPQAMHRLKMAAKKAWFEFNGSEGPDWSDANQDKHFIEFCHEADKFYIDLIVFSQSLGQIYFPTEESAKWIIDNLQDELKLVMGIE